MWKELPMPSRLSDAQANNSLDVRFSKAVNNAPDSLYFAIVTTAPTTNTGTSLVEASGTAYTRVLMLNNATNFPAAVARLKTNGVAITWPTAGAAWGTAVGIAWFDDPVAGAFLGYAALNSGVPIGLGATPQIGVGNFQIGSTGS